MPLREQCDAGGRLQGVPASCCQAGGQVGLLLVGVAMHTLASVQLINDGCLLAWRIRQAANFCRVLCKGAMYAWAAVMVFRA